MAKKEEKSEKELIEEELGFKIPEFEAPEIKKIREAIQRLRMIRFA